MTPIPVLKVELQRHPSDCGVACLAMFAGVSYEDALIALGGEVPNILRGGVYFTEMQRAAVKLGLALRRKRTADVDGDEGLLQIKFNPPGDGQQHVVVLTHGLIFDTDGTAWEPSDYLKAKRCKAGSILVKDE